MYTDDTAAVAVEDGVDTNRGDNAAGVNEGDELDDNTIVGLGADAWFALDGATTAEFGVDARFAVVEEGRVAGVYDNNVEGEGDE